MAVPVAFLLLVCISGSLSVPVVSKLQVFLPTVKHPFLHRLSLDFFVREVANDFTIVVGNGTAKLPTASFEELPIYPTDEVFLVRLGSAADNVTAQLISISARVLTKRAGYAIVGIAPDNVALLDTVLVRKERVTFLPRQLPINFQPASLRYRPDLKQQFVDAVDSAEHLEKVKVLSGAVGFDLDGIEVFTKTRYTYSPESLLSARYIQQTFQGLGLETIMQPFSVAGRATQNVIGVKRGTGSPEQIVVIGAHFDSISQDPMSVAPGAIDDASGTAAVLHIAEIFAAYETKKTIHFVCFSGEEQGLYGSTFYVSQLDALDWMVTEAIIMDMISYSNQHFGVLVEGTKAYTSLMNIGVSNFRSFGGDNFSIVTSTHSFGSDHVPFQEAGIPAFLAIERDETSYPYYHKTGDTWHNVDELQSKSIMRGMVATLFDLSSPYIP